MKGSRKRPIPDPVVRNTHIEAKACDSCKPNYVSLSVCANVYLGQLKWSQDFYYELYGIETALDEPIREAKVLLSSCSLASSVVNEAVKDVFEVVGKMEAHVASKNSSSRASMGSSSESVSPWRQRYWFIDSQIEEKGDYRSKVACSSVKLSVEGAKEEIILAHNTYGHCGWGKASKIADIKIPLNWQPFCRICAATRLHRAEKKKKKQELHPGKYAGDYLHIDLHGKVRDVTQNGMKYFAIVVDDFSGRIFIFLLKRKKYFVERLDELIGRIQAETGNLVGRIKTDGDGIFRKDSEEMQKLISKHGINLLSSTPYTSHFNGKAERGIGVVKEMARSMLFQSGLPRRFWGEAVIYAAQVLNRMPRKGTPGPFTCPLSAWRGVVIERPGRALKPFGCEVWALDNKEVPKGASRRLTAQIGTPCIFLGLQSDKGSYRVLSLVHARVFNTVDVVFNPSSFPVAIKKNYASDFDVLVEESQFCLERPDPSGDAEGGIPLSTELDVKDASPALIEGASMDMQAPALLSPFNTPGRKEGLPPSSRARERAPSRQLLESFQAHVNLRSKEGNDDHDSKSEDLWDDKVERNALCCMIDIICDASKLSRSRVIHLLNAEHNRSGEVIFINSLAAVVHNIPKTQTQAYKSPDKQLWQDAEQKHLTTLFQAKTIELVDLPAGKRAIPVKFVYNRKGGDKEGRDKLEYTARLVLLGFLQREGIDYEETFAPTVQWRIMRYFIAIWTILDWDYAEKIDLKQAFNTTPTDVNFYTTQAPGHLDIDNPLKVYKVNGSLPGAKQSSRNLHLALRRIAQQAGFECINADQCVYRWFSADSCLYLLVWVDDTFCFGHGQAAWRQINHLIDELQSRSYKVHRLGDITKSDVLGVKVRRDRVRRISTLDLEEYLINFLKSAYTPAGVSYWDCGEERETPCDPRLIHPTPVKAKPAEGVQPQQSRKKKAAPKKGYNYLSRVMALMYAAVICRPDLSYAIGVAARGSANPTEEHYACLHHICLYLRKSVRLKLVYRGVGKDTFIRLLSDASWINDPRDRATSMGRAAFLGACCIDWKSQWIQRIMTSTNHAEFYSSNEATKDAVFYTQLGKELKLPVSAIEGRIPIFGDNEKAQALARGQVAVSKCRHYDLLLFYQREQYELKVVDFIDIPSALNISDVFTKGRFSKEQFHNLIRQLMGLAPIEAFRMYAVFMGACRKD